MLIPRSRCPHRALVALVLPLLSACGGSSSTPVAPTQPQTPTASTIAVTVSSPLRVGETTQATGTAMLSNGQTSTLTSGWQSDNPAVASVTASGAVTGLSNGQTSIAVSSGSAQGRQGIRVVPDYQGTWQGRIAQTSCVEPGEWRLVDFCKLNPADSVWSFVLAIQQSGESLTVTPDYFEDAVMPAASSTIREDGSTVASSVFRDPDSTLSVETRWTINSPRRGEMSGTVSEIWRVSGIASEARVEYNIASASRSSTTSAGGRVGSPKSRAVRPITRLRSRMAPGL